MRPGLSCVLAFGVWLSGSSLLAHAEQGQVKAGAGGIAIGGSVSHSTINIGLSLEKVDELVRDRTRPLEELTAQQRENITLLKEKLDLNEHQVRRALDIVGEANVPPERLAAKLVEIAERYKVLVLQTGSAAQPGDSANVITLKAETQKAIQGGDLAKADALLAQVDTEQRSALDRLVVNAADTAARRGQISLTRLRYAEAAAHFAEAAALFPPESTHEDKRLDYLEQEAKALYLQGDESGDNRALLSSIERWKRLIELSPRERVPIDWAKMQIGLGVALETLGGRESGTDNLRAALDAYDKALQVTMRREGDSFWVTAPLDHARTLINIGNVLVHLGQRKSGDGADFYWASVWYRDALKEITRERMPLEWAMIQKNLGIALSLRAERAPWGERTPMLEQAVAAFREALKEWTRELMPLQWAAAQHGLGWALLHLGERETGTAKLEEAVAAIREALKERTRERVPLDWAETQNTLGNAMLVLGERESGTDKIEAAIAAFGEALKERTRGRVPLDWAQSQSNLGHALAALGAREDATDKLEAAVAAYREALSERTRERMPIQRARSLGGQGVALMLLAERREDGAMAKEALSQIHEAYQALLDMEDYRSSGIYWRQLPKARALVTRLSRE